MTVTDQEKADGFHRCLTKTPGTINYAFGLQSSRDADGSVVDTQVLPVEYSGVQLDLMLTCTNVGSCRIRGGKLPIHVRMPNGDVVGMMLDIKESASGHIGAWVRTTHENFALLQESLVVQ